MHIVIRISAAFDSPSLSFFPVFVFCLFVACADYFLLNLVGLFFDLSLSFDSNGNSFAPLCEEAIWHPEHQHGEHWGYCHGPNAKKTFANPWKKKPKEKTRSRSKKQTLGPIKNYAYCRYSRRPKKTRAARVMFKYTLR